MVGLFEPILIASAPNMALVAVLEQNIDCILWSVRIPQTQKQGLVAGHERYILCCAAQRRQQFKCG
jgi:hypothetical protein